MGEATLVYDDDCGFCTWCAIRIDARADVQLVGFSELSAELRDMLPENYEECAHLVVDGEVYSCGESIEQALVRTDIDTDLKPLADFLSQFDEYNTVRERAYRLVADNRDLFGQVLSAETPTESTSEPQD